MTAPDKAATPLAELIAAIEIQFNPHQEETESDSDYENRLTQQTIDLTIAANSALPTLLALLPLLDSPQERIRKALERMRGEADRTGHICNNCPLSQPPPKYGCRLDYCEWSDTTIAEFAALLSAELFAAPTTEVKKWA